MARLLDEPREVDPVELTHFDAWDSGYYEDYDGWVTEAATVLTAWEKSLDVYFDFESLFGSVEGAVRGLGDLVWDVAVLRVLAEGFDVYYGDSMIEIYEPEGF